MNETVAGRIAAYAAEERLETVAPGVLHDAKRALIDWYGAALAGCREEALLILEKAFAEDIGRGEARLISGPRATTRTAAFINAAASHVLELDDIFKDGLYHPGAPVIAAALAAAQADHIDGRRFLLAVLTGYEVSTRVSAAINPTHYKYWHTTGTVGCIGAAVAASVALGCNAVQIANAVATATSFASGLQQAFRSSAMTKPLHAAHAADTGVWAALGARSGLTGALDILEGPAGFGCAMGGNPAWDVALSSLGRSYNVTNLTFKDYACCGQTFPAVDGVLGLVDEYALDPATIEQISIGTTQETIAMTNDYEAKDAYAAKFSLPYVVSSAVLFRNLRLAAFEPERLADARTRALMSRVEMVSDAEAQARFPKQRTARVKIKLTDGRVVERFQSTRRGDPDWPLTDDDLEAKYLELAVPVIGLDDASQLRETIWTIESCGDVGNLVFVGAINRNVEKRKAYG